MVCIDPEIRPGSQIDPLKHVTVVGYDDLVARIQQPGPHVPWTRAHWDTFIAHRNLEAEEEFSPQGQIRKAAAAAADEYLGNFVQSTGPHPPLVDTDVCVNGRPAPRPDVAGALTRGRIVLLHGRSGVGKTLWARATADQLARDGHVAVWLDASAGTESFNAALRRANMPTPGCRQPSCSTPRTRPGAASSSSSTTSTGRPRRCALPCWTARGRSASSIPAAEC